MASDHPEPVSAEEVRGLVERLRRDSCRCPNLDPAAAALEALLAERERLRERVAEVEYWNGAVAVCSEHVQLIVSATPGVCVICDMDALEADLARLREALREIEEALTDRVSVGHNTREWRALTLTREALALSTGEDDASDD